MCTVSAELLARAARARLFLSPARKKERLLGKLKNSSKKPSQWRLFRLCRRAALLIPALKQFALVVSIESTGRFAAGIEIFVAVNFIIQARPLNKTPRYDILTSR